MSGDFEPSCPLPLRDYPQVLLAHGGGGRLMHQLLNELILPILGDADPLGAHDAAVLAPPGGRLAFTSDGYVVKPLEFPGGDIGSLAIHGTVNDLAMAGAQPLYLSVSLIIEEGLPMTTLSRLLQSARAAADRAGVRIVTGDTKVVDRGKGDGLYLVTSGVGVVEPGVEVHPRRIRPGDAVLVNGDLGRHGIAIMACREGLEFETAIESDSAALNGVVAELLAAGVDLHCLRDLTRGGLVSALNELAQAAGCGIGLREAELPVAGEVAAACEILGLDPLYVACEGRMAVIVPAEQAEAALAVLRRHHPEAIRVGEVGARGRPEVLLHSRFGATRVLDVLSGEQLPRIC